MENITAVRFKRKENSAWEPGILFGDGSFIIDSNSSAVEDIYDYQKLAHSFCINMRPIMDSLQELCDIANEGEKNLPTILKSTSAQARVEQFSMRVKRP